VKRSLKPPTKAGPKPAPTKAASKRPAAESVPEPTDDDVSPDARAIVDALSPWLLWQIKASLQHRGALKDEQHVMVISQQQQQAATGAGLQPVEGEEITVAMIEAVREEFDLWPAWMYEEDDDEG
jgi:hypothetical protein